MMTDRKHASRIGDALMDDPRLREVWDLLDGLEGSPVVVEARSHARQLAGRRQPRVRWLRPGLGLGAAAAAAAIALVYLQPANDLRTEIGEVRTITLPDGSAVTLDTATRLEVHFTETAREVRLSQGQAYFVVAHDASKPFRVFTKTGEIDAIGTQFDVRVEPDGTTVTLLEGRVEVHGRAGEDQPETFHTNLAPGEQVALPVASAGPIEPQHPARLDGVTAWRKSKLDLDNTTLAEAVAEMNRYSRTKIRITDPALANRRISGSFRTGDVTGFLNAVETYFGAKVLQTSSSSYAVGMN